jgi:predicted transcriptional regulator
MIIDTEIFNNKTIKPIGQYTNTEAYLYLLSISDFNGVLDVSVKHVSQTLVWSKSKVYRFIDKLVEDGFLTKLCNKSDTKVKDLKYCIKGNCGFLRNNMTKNRNEIGMDFKDEIENESSVKKEEPIKEAPKKAPKSPKKESTALYSKMMALYSDWFKDRNNGLPPNINVVEGVSLKKIIAYFEPLVYNKAQLNGVILEKGSEQADNEVINAFKLIFNQWETMDEFLKNGVKLSQINSNLSNIINQLRNKNGKLTKADKQAAAVERNKQEWAEILSGNLNP